MQPRRSEPKEGDTVTAARDPGRVTAILYSRLATILRYLAIILLYICTYYHSHPRLQPSSDNYHTYAYEAERWRTCPYTMPQNQTSSDPITPVMECILTR
jgi:hypothetical protein